MNDNVKDYPPYLDYPKPRKTITNADRIRATSDEELAEWLYSLNDEHCDSICPPANPACLSQKNCVKCWLDWLEEEVGE